LIINIKCIYHKVNWTRIRTYWVYASTTYFRCGNVFADYQ